MASSETAILLRDAQGEKSLGKIGGLFKSSSKPVCRGELLILLPRVKVIPHKDNKTAYKYQLSSDPSVTLFCHEEDVAPLSDYEYRLMVGVESREARFEVFRKDILDWGSKLKAGTLVRVALPSKTPVSNQRAISVIRYVGLLPNENGIQFGVEILEEQYRHQGSSNGVLGGGQYFECEENCALFVSLDRLSELPPPVPTNPQRQHQYKQDAQRQEMQGAPQLQEQLLQQYGAAQAQPPDNGTHPNNALLQHGAGALMLQGTILCYFSMGSTVQVLSNPPRYGVIQWIGTLPGILEGRIAGVELEDPMEGCTDGTWKGVRYFSCQMGHGFFCPLSSLLPDQRSAQATTLLYNQNAEINREHVEQIEKLNRQIKELEANYSALQQKEKKSDSQLVQLQQDLQKEKESSAKLHKQLSEMNAESVTFGIEPWKVSRNKVELGSVLGGGGWGVVYEGKLQVAVKHFYPNIMSKQNLVRLKREMQMLALIRHPNLLQFIAAMFDENEDHERRPPYIITELLDMSLRSAYEKGLLRSNSLLSIFVDTSRALDYLHRRYDPIIHRDVSSANVLLRRLENEKWTAKLSDLGSANLAKEAYTLNEGARVYCAPEAFTLDPNARSAGTLTPKIDVYSYGIMLCEVATSTFPDKEFPSLLSRVQREWPQLHQLIVACTNRSPEQRPTMASVLTSLEAFPP